MALGSMDGPKEVQEYCSVIQERLVIVAVAHQVAGCILLTTRSQLVICMILLLLYLFRGCKGCQAVPGWHRATLDGPSATI